MKTQAIKQIIRYSIIPILAIALFACHKGKETNFTLQISKVKTSVLHTQQLLLSMHQTNTEDLHKKVSEFLGTPSFPYQNMAKNAWSQTINSYYHLSPYRLMEPSLNAGFTAHQNYLTLTPINPAYIDYTQANPASGIIQDAVNYPTLNENYLESWNQVGSPENVSIGFHVLEFLLWGEDLSLMGTGGRTSQDYVGAGATTSRRRTYLTFVNNSIRKHLNAVSFSGTYEQQMNDMDPQTYLKLLLGSMQQLIDSEIIAKDLQPVMQSGDPSKEMSNFSDQTLVQVKAKIEAVAYVFDGSTLYSSEGDYYFLKDLMEEVESGSSQQTSAALNTCFEILNGMSNTFEQAISDPTDKAALQSLITNLQKVSGTFRDLAAKF